MRPSWDHRAAALIVAVFVGAVVLMTGAASILPQGLGGPLFSWNSPVEALTQWDSGWYLSIADTGYRYTPGQQSPVAFFPAYPMAIRAVMSLGIEGYVAGVLISCVCGPLALWLFFRWAKRVVPADQAYFATLLFAVYPFAYYLFGAMYSEGLFLTLVVAAFLFLERGQLGWATFFGALATTCRPVAPAVVIGLVIRQMELRRQRGEKVRVIDFLPFLSAAGMAAYVAFLGWEFGDPLAFAHVQAAPGWDHVPDWHTWLKITWFKTMFPRVDPEIAIRLGAHAALTLGAFALLWPTRKHLGWGYAAYAAVSVAIPAIGIKDLHGMGRYAMAAFPCVLTLSLLIAPRPRLQRVAWAISTALFIWFAIDYARGGWTA